MGIELLLFLALGGLAIACAIGMILSKNAVHSALFLIANFACVAVLFLMLESPFLSMVQIAVYAGAIMVLFLFVIMLLGAEQTADLDKRYRWLTGAATTLAVSLLAAFGVPLLIGGVSFPAPPAAQPQVRFVHAANIPQSEGVTVTLTGAQTYTFTAAFAEAGDFTPIDAGSYQVSVTRLPDGQPVSPPAPLTIAPGQLGTLMLYGALDLNTSSFPAITVLPSSFAAEGDHMARIVAFNGYGEGSYSLVELGPNKALDTRQRDLLDENGEPVLDASGQATKLTTIDDKVVVSGMAFGAAAAFGRIDEGTYNFALVDEATLEVVKTVDNYVVEADTEDTLIFVEDAEAEASLDGTLRPRLLDRFGSALNFQTAATYGSPASFGQVLFTEYLLPVNLVGFLLLVALVGVIVLTRPDGEFQRRNTARRKVARPLTSVIAAQTGHDVNEEAPRLPEPQSGD